MVHEQTAKEVARFYRTRIKSSVSADNGRLLKEEVYGEYKKFCKHEGFMAADEAVFWACLHSVVGKKEILSRTILTRDAEKNRKRAIVGWQLRG